MTAKQFLLQAQGIDKRIYRKLEQIETLRSLAEKSTPTISKIPHNPTPDGHRMEKATIKIIDLKNEVEKEIDRLLEVKQRVTAVIKCVPNVEYENLLEMRYISGKSWEEISEEMGYSMRSTYRLHGNALLEVKKIINEL